MSRRAAWALSVGLLGWLVAAAVGYGIGCMLQDHDTRIIVTFMVSAFVAWPMGLLTLLVWDAGGRWSRK